MKPKHLAARIAACKSISACSPCVRQKHGAVIVNPERNTIVSDGYNGTPRKSIKELCGGEICSRKALNIPSGERTEIGCHHAEANAITNAAAAGISTQDCIIIITGEPCLSCAKLIHHAGIIEVYLISGGYTCNSGAEYLTQNNIIWRSIDEALKQ